MMTISASAAVRGPTGAGPSTTEICGTLPDVGHRAKSPYPIEALDAFADPRTARVREPDYRERRRCNAESQGLRRLPFDWCC